ncbi:MAG: twin transmembrane helix small protein [Alphaproteobacteria bacterium]|nr:twin transmembrane helix small protein [Alphaproteobacteria bacterium]MCB1840166.1 twin transmembrane helix small protein [Alphaproteobacteria bacterium]
MHNVFVVLMLLAATAVLGVLVVGIVGMLKGGEFNKKYGNKLMQARVILQGLALLLFALAYMSR